MHLFDKKGIADCRTRARAISCCRNANVIRKANMAKGITTYIRVADDNKSDDGKRYRTYNVFNRADDTCIGHVFETFTTHEMDYKSNRESLAYSLVNGKRVNGANTRARTVAMLRDAYMSA